MIVIGIDEAGRGALAGPVCVGALACDEDFDWKNLYALVSRQKNRDDVPLRDSKKLSPNQREILYGAIEQSGIRYAHAFADASVIDDVGISDAVRVATAQAIAMLGLRPRNTRVLLDAGLSVATEWNQQSFVRGDESIPAIAMASIVAKVSRDRFMIEMASDFPLYNFEIHKGYGTASHLSAIRAHGLSDAHRKSWHIV